MHSNINITDGVYGILSDNDARGQIVALGCDYSTEENRDIQEIRLIVREVLNKLGTKIYGVT